METFEKALLAAVALAELTKKHDEAERLLAGLKEELEAKRAEFKQYIVPELREPAARSYKLGSLASKILLRLWMANGAPLPGNEITDALGVESRQVHSILSRMVAAGHATRASRGEYTITDAGREALESMDADSKEGETIDEFAAEND